MVYNVAAVVATTAAGMVYTFVRFWGFVFFSVLRMYNDFSTGNHVAPFRVVILIPCFSVCTRTEHQRRTAIVCNFRHFRDFIFGSLVAYEFAYSPVIWLFPDSTLFRLEKKKKKSKSTKNTSRV